MAECDRAIGNRIKELRETRGISQQELAYVIGVSREKIAKIEAGDREAKAQDIICIANHFGTSTDFLLRGIETENIEACKDMGLSNSTVNTLRSWQAPQEDERIVDPTYSHCLEALEILINQPLGNTFLFLLRDYLASDTSEVYTIGEKGFEECLIFLKSRGNKKIHVTSDMLESALLEQQKESLRELKKVLKGEEHEQKAKR